MAFKLFRKKGKSEKLLDESYLRSFEESTQKYIENENKVSNIRNEDGSYSHYNIDLTPNMDPDFGPCITGLIETFHDRVQIRSSGTFETMRVLGGSKFIPNYCGYVHHYVSLKDINGKLQHFVIFISGNYHRCQVVSSKDGSTNVYSSYNELPSLIKTIFERRDEFLIRVNPLGELQSKSHSAPIEPIGPTGPQF